MEPLGDGRRRELLRSIGEAGAIDGGRHAAWPEAVGEGGRPERLAARIGRDGTLHVATSSALGASSSTACSSGRAGRSSPKALRRPGPALRSRSPLPELGRRAYARDLRPSRPRRTDRERRAEREPPASKTATYERSPRDAIAASLARAPRFRPPALIDLHRARNGEMQGFFMAEAAYTAKDITVLEGPRARPPAARACTSARRVSRASITSSTKWSTTPSTRLSPAATTSSRCHDPSGQLRHRVGQRVGHPGRRDARAGAARLDVVLTKLHAGGKFGGGGYKVSGGLHGVGVSVVNALSEWLVAEVQRDGKRWRQEFARGEPVGDLEVVGRSPGRATPARRSRSSPTPRCSRRSEFYAATLEQRLRETAFLTRGLRIVLTDERAGGKTVEFHYEGGIRDFVAHVNHAKDPIHKHVVYFEGEVEDSQVEVAMQWNTSYVESVFSFANNINTTEGGAHLFGLQGRAHGGHSTGTRARRPLLKEKEDNLEGEDVREGLAAVISVKLREPQFEGQTKTKLGNP